MKLIKMYSNKKRWFVNNYCNSCYVVESQLKDIDVIRKELSIKYCAYDLW